MIPLDGESFETNQAKDDEHHERNDLLRDLELHECERAAVALKTHAVGGHLTAVLQQSYSPREEDNDV